MSNAMMLFRKAQASHQRGDLAAAIKGYETLLRSERGNYELTYMLAVALYQAGQLERSAAQFAAAAKLGPRRIEAHKDLGLVLMKLNRHDGALESFERALGLDPRSPELLLNRGIAHKALGRLPEAVESYMAAIRLKPGLAEAHNNLGNALSALGRMAEAQAAYAQAVALKPSYLDAQINGARLLLEAGEHEACLAWAGKALTLHPASAALRAIRASGLLGLSRPAEALEEAAQAAERDPLSAEAALVRGHALRDCGRTAEALAAFETAARLDPASAGALLAGAQLLIREGRHGEAIMLCDRAIAAQPGEAGCYFTIGRAFEAREEMAEAAGSFARAAELQPGWQAAHLRHGLALLAIGRHQDALTACDRAIAVGPRSAETLRARARALKELDRHAEALDTVSEAIALDPERTGLYGLRATLYRELGNPEAAFADIGTSLRLPAVNTDGGEALAADWSQLLSADAIPEIYASEDELRRTREHVDRTLESLVRRYPEPLALTPGLAAVSARGISHLTGFYLAYHQRNDRETMRMLSAAAARLLGIGAGAAPPARKGGGRLRIGIASQRLRNHNGANWAYNWFAQLPRGDYEFFTYAFETRKDALAAKFAALGTHRQMAFEASRQAEIIARMREDGLDALMLTDVGMTAVSRFLSLHRIAPCQFTAWGHPVTTGAAAMDFYLSSDLMEPPGAHDHYTERLVRMPNLALYLEEEDEDQGPAAEKNFGLPEGRLCYGCLQSLYKYLPRHDVIYPMIAREVPEALFVFIEGQRAAMTAVMRQRLDAAFRAHGLDAARHVLFVPRQSARDFDSLMRQMHVNIDSIGWSGGNTSLRSIGFGVPLITLAGDFMRGRHTSAMFTMMGTPELIETSLEAYAARLAALGRDRDARRHVAELLSANAHRLRRDASFIAALDGFLKQHCRA